MALDNYHTGVFRDVQDQAHGLARSKGFWDGERDSNELFMLIVSELGEAQEAHRRGRFADIDAVSDDDFTVSFEEHVKDTFEDELADVCLRILDFMGAMSWSVEVEDIDIRGWSLGKCLMGVVRALSSASAFFPCRMTAEVMNYDRKYLGTRNYMLKALSIVAALAVSESIDLASHIDMKMVYNGSRPRLHGKRY